MVLGCVSGDVKVPGTRLVSLAHCVQIFGPPHRAIGGRGQCCVLSGIGCLVVVSLCVVSLCMYVLCIGGFGLVSVYWLWCVLL